MPTTPTYALPYPSSTDPADVPTDLGKLANAVDALAVLGYWRTYDASTIQTQAGKGIYVNGNAAANGWLTSQVGNVWVGAVNPSAAASPFTFFGMYYDGANNRGSIGALSGGVAWRDVLVGESGNLLANQLKLGAGNANFDTTLYRYAANNLKTDGSLMAVGANPVLGVVGFIYAPTTAAGDALQSIVSTLDSKLRLSIGYDGLIRWGPGGTGERDTNLYRRSAGALGSNGALIVYDGAAYQIALTQSGGVPAIMFGSASDTMLYRPAAGQLKTDGLFIAGGQFYSQAAGAGGGFIYNPAAAGGNAFQISIQGEANPRFYFDSSGVMRWGAGGAAAVDTNLYRASAQNLTTDGNFNVAYTIIVDKQSSGTTTGAGIYFGGAQDVHLFRPAAGVLKTDGNFQAFGATSQFGTGAYTVQAGAMGPASQAGLAFVGDTFLYRSAAGVIRTDGRFAAADANVVFHANPAVAGGYALFSQVAGEAQPRFSIQTTGGMSWGPGGASAVDLSLYRSAAGNLKTDGILRAGLDIYARDGAAQQVIIGSVGPAAAGILFGSASDTQLSRSAAGVLKVGSPADQQAIHRHPFVGPRHIDAGLATINGPGSVAITFTKAFSSPPIVVLGPTTPDGCSVSAVSATGATVYTNHAGTSQVFWIAEGPD